MKYKVMYTAGAKKDLRNIFRYISEELLAPENAAGQTERIMTAIRKLDTMPNRNRLYEEEPWHSRGLRFFPVDNYLVFYKTDDETIDFSNVKIEPIFEEMVDFDTFAKSDFRAVKILACEAVPKSKKLLKFTLDDGERKDRVILSGIHEYYEPEELVGKTAIAIVNLPPRKMMGIDSEGMLISAVHEEDGHEGLNLLMVNDRIPAGAKLY